MIRPHGGMQTEALPRPARRLARALGQPWRMLQPRLAALVAPIRSAFAPRLGVLHQYRPRRLRLPPPDAGPLPSPLPVISIVTPSYNQGRFLERTLRSVLDQGYPALEYLVQDGGSTDDAAAVLARYRTRLAHCESGRDRGQADAINRGFRRATGDVLAYLNSDDLLLPGALAFVARYFHRHPEVDVIYSHRVVIDEQDREVGRWLLPPHDDDVLTWCDYIPQETLFWRRRVWGAVGGALDESFHFALDWDLLLRFRESGARFVRVPRFLAAFRVHAQQKTSALLDGVGAAEMARLRRWCHGREVTEAEVALNVRRYLRRHVGHRILSSLGLSALMR
jgi:carbamoyltransferase